MSNKLILPNGTSQLVQPREERAAPSMSSAEGTQSSFVVVDLADMKATNHPTGCLVTQSLGSCVAVAIFDPEARIGGLLNYILPDSHICRERAMTNPFLFADTGIPLLFRRAYKLGALKERIVTKVAGASNVLDPKENLRLGQQNYEALSRIMESNHVELKGKFVGGFKGMALKMYLETGRVVVELGDGQEVEI